LRILVPSGRGRDLSNVTDDFNEIETYDTLETRRAKLEMWMAKRVGTRVTEKYRGRQWKIQVDLENEMLIVACDSISNYKGYHISMVGRTIGDLETESIKAAGEILERHNLARSKHFNPDKFESLPRDFRDSVIASDSAAEPI